MRVVELRYHNYVPLIHDLIKNTVIMFVVEILQNRLIGDPLLDKVFLTMIGFTLIGNLVYYLVVDRYIVGAGPILSGPPATGDKQE